MTIEAGPETIQSLIATIKILQRRASTAATELAEIQCALRKAEHELDQLMRRLTHIGEHNEGVK